MYNNTIFGVIILIQVVVKTVSGSVASWPATGNVTTRPLPVSSIREEQEAGPSPPQIRLAWEPNSESQQDSYKVGRNAVASHRLHPLSNCHND